MLVEISANLVMDGESEWQIRLAGWPTKEWKGERGGFLSRFLFRCSLGIVGLSLDQRTQRILKRVTGGRGAGAE